MVEPISTALAGLALVKQSVEFIKSNISTAKDIGDIINHVDAAMNGEQQLIKERDRKGDDPFAVENVAKSVLDARIARENLQEIKLLIEMRFPGAWGQILAERKRRIDAKKQAIKEAKAKKIKKMQEDFLSLEEDLDFTELDIDYLDVNFLEDLLDAIDELGIEDEEDELNQFISAIPVSGTRIGQDAETQITTILEGDKVRLIRNVNQNVSLVLNSDETYSVLIIQDGVSNIITINNGSSSVIRIRQESG
jgi:hypothetical protein